MLGEKLCQIKNARIWEHGAETPVFDYYPVASHYTVNVYSGPVRDMLRQLHLVSEQLT